jgi:hypothetical protein
MQPRNFTQAQLHTEREMQSQLLVTGELATISSRNNLRLQISFRLYLDILPQRRKSMLTRTPSCLCVSR